MLVLSRRVGESIVIGEDVVVTIVSLGGGRARLGIEAPRRVPVYRAEVGPRTAEPPASWQSEPVFAETHST